MAKISLKGLAKFMTANSTGQRKVLHDFKYPKPEGQAQAAYYKEARNAIVRFHNQNRDLQFLKDEIDDLRLKATTTSRTSKTRLLNNASALSSYLRYFSKRELSLKPIPSLGFNFSGVVINAKPDLYVVEKGKDIIIKLEFVKEQPHPKVTKIITQSLFEAARLKGFTIDPRMVEYIDVRRGNIHRVAGIKTRLAGEIKDACANIIAIWDSI